MVKNWIIYILTVLGSIAFFLVYEQWFAWYWLLVLGAIPVIAIVFSFCTALFFQVRLKVPPMITMNMETDIVFSTKSGKYLPGQLYSVRMTIRELMSGEIQKYHFVCQIGTDYSVNLNTEHCGTYMIESLKVRVYDMFGLIPIPRKADLKGEIPVLPIQRMPEIVTDSNGFRAKILSKSVSPYSELYDIREYIPGDPIKNVHWKMSAKKDEILVREPQEETHGRARVEMPLVGTRDTVDQNLGEVLFTIRYFLAKDIPVSVKIVSRYKKSQVFEVRSKQEMDRTMRRILRMKIEGGLPNEQ